MTKLRTFAFIDASNLFYGGEKSLGWKIDYAKLRKYLERKYGVSKAYYFGGAEIHNYKYDYLGSNTLPLDELEGYPSKQIEVDLLKRHLQRIRFYQNLQEFGYELRIKPVKMYRQPGGGEQRKANCDVDLAFYLMKEKTKFDRVLILSGDGDFLPVLKYLREIGKEVIILARGPRTAREIRRFVGSDFKDFVRLENEIKFTNEKGGHTKYPPHV